MSSWAIEIKGLRKSFGNKVVLDGMDLTVPEGSVFALLGPNGAGKTTLINTLSTLIAPDSGTARVTGHDVVTESEKVKQSISLTGQYAAVDQVLTAEENLMMMGRLSGLTKTESRKRSYELLKFFDLEEAAYKKLKTYSGGMRRRLDLAISLVVSRSVLFLDEPTTGLDTRSRRDVLKSVQDLAAQGMTIFLTTQYLEEADQLADTIAVIAEGQVVAQGTPEELKSRIGGEVIELSDENDKIIREIPIDGSIQACKSVIDEMMDVVPEHTHVNIRRPSMDDVFLSLTDTKREVS